MKGARPLFLGIFGTFAFSWLGLIVIPNAQIGRLDPQMDEDGADVYPAPKSGMVDRGRLVFAANGCVYCHTQQVRADYAASDIARKWGDRRSAPRDYIFERPVLLGKMRIGPDLANIGQRAPSVEENAPAPGAPAVATSANPPVAGVAAPAGSPAAPPAPGAASPAPVTAGQTANTAPAANTETAAIPENNEALPYSAAWHHRHLYAPRSVFAASIMPSFRFLYEKRRISGARADDALQLSGPDAPPEGWEIVPSYDAKSLVAYLMSLNQSHPLAEVKSTTPASAPLAGKAAK